jgi:3-oxoacyl-[acyl-carrier protein] reductase
VTPGSTTHSNGSPGADWWPQVTAIVTGAGRGIGHGIAEEFARRGAHVVVAEFDKGRGREAEAAVAAVGGSCRAVVCDVTESAQVDQLVRDTVADRGRLDIVVNNAGITRTNMLWNLTDEEWSAVLDTNLKSQFFMMRAAVREWMRDHGGSMVNISSIAGLRGSIGQVNYAAAKAGVIGLTKSGALELGRYGVRVNAVAPGTTETEMTAPILSKEKLRAKLESEVVLGRLGTVADIARAVAFLAGPEASWITGKVLTVDGGAYN